MKSEITNLRIARSIITGLNSCKKDDNSNNNSNIKSEFVKNYTNIVLASYTDS